MIEGEPTPEEERVTEGKGTMKEKPVTEGDRTTEEERSMEEAATTAPNLLLRLGAIAKAFMVCDGDVLR